MTKEPFPMPPANYEAEEAVIGSILIDGEMIKSINLIPSDFLDESNNIIFHAMVLLKESGLSINQITVSQRLKEQGKLEHIGGAERLSLFVAETPTSMDCPHYADIVHKLAVSRRLLLAGNTITQLGYEGSTDIVGQIAKADKLLLDLRKTAGGSHIITPEERSKILAERYTTLYTKEEGIAIETGLLDLDKKLGGGLFPGDLVVLGARPGVGKTSLLEAIANHIGHSSNVLFCSAEMNMESLSDRDVAGQIGVPVETVRFGNYDDDTMTAILDKALPWIEEQKIYHLDFSRNFQINTANIYQTAYELKERQGLSLIVVDYLGLLTDRYGNNNNDRIGYITRTLKEMAMTLDVPLVAAHQLNRGLESREEKRPQMQDLRDSGNVEQDADVILFLYRENYYKMNINDNIAEVLIAKNRQGTSGRRVKVLWDEKKHTYLNLALEEVL